MAKYIYLYSLLMFITCTWCEGQNESFLTGDNIRHEIRYMDTSTVPDAISRTLKQDKKGNIWIAAFDGVFRYDGKSFTNVIREVSQARFFSVLEDGKGNFWFSSIGSGVYYYDGEAFKNFTTGYGLADDRVTCIYEDRAGTIWFGTNTGVSHYDGKSFQNFSIGDVNTIVEDKTGEFWFGTRDNVFIYDGKKTNLFNHKGNTFTNVRTIIEDKKGSIWLGGKDGLWRYDPSGGSTLTRFTENFVAYVYEDKQGNIWTSSEWVDEAGWAKGWELSRYDERSSFSKKTTIVKTDEHSKMIFGILEANDGSIWFGSHGVFRYYKNTLTEFKGRGVK
jgi:ligand-binding sensor domain-containing protein